MKIFLEAENNGDLERIIRYNIGKSYQLRKELKELSDVYIESKSVEKSNHKEELINQDLLDLENDEEYLYYYTNLFEDINDAKTEEEKRLIISENIPTIDNKNYSGIVSRIKLELLKEIHELEVLKQNEEDQEFIKEIELEVNSIKSLIELITEVQTSKIADSLNSDNNSKNKLVFLQTPTGSIYAENDLYVVPEEYYESFKDLILSIEDGTFKNVKRFNGSNFVLQGICEVKDFKTRVIFHRISKNTYIIIDIFMKKSNNDKGYIEPLKTRVDYYKKHRDIIIEQLKDDTYLQYQQEIRDNLVKGLEEKNVIKTMKRG